MGGGSFPIKPMCPCNDPPRNRWVPLPVIVPRAVCVAVLYAFVFGRAALLGVPADARETRIHPAVVRVVAPDESGRSLGSGALVAVTDSYGLVLTNWHVVRDAAAAPTVVFPDGFRSAATIARVDQDWDLAALVVWRPHAAPIPLAAMPPKPGEPLAIAGYGKGQYRVDTGRCTQYLSPGRHHPYELVEVSASARQGDSGGPIFNDRGELAGVLFGSAFGRTTGSHSGRVRQFLAPLWNDFYQQQPGAGSMIAGPARSSPPVASIQGRPAVGSSTTGGGPSGRVSVSSGADSRPPSVSARPDCYASAASAGPYQGPRQPHGASASAVCEGSPNPVPGVVETPSSPTQAGASWVASSTPLQADSESPESTPSRSDQLKTILAAIGILALVFHGVRLLGRAIEV